MSGKSVRRAFDRDRLASGGVTLAGPVRRVRQVMAGPREMSVRAALEWAFGVECARLEFEDEGGGPVYGADGIWRLMQRHALGCTVDGGGRSSAHPDAEVIASFVAALPVARGGRGMAVQVAALARAGIEPDWMPDARARCVPVRWRHSNQHGTMAATEVVETVTTEHRGRKIVRDVLCCPVTWTPTGAQIAAARRGWLDWWGALLHIGADLRACGRLETVRITQAMPQRAPWNTRG